MTFIPVVAAAVVAVVAAAAAVAFADAVDFGCSLVSRTCR